MKTFSITIVLLACATLLSACGGSAPPSPNTVVAAELQGAPEWVLQGYDAESEDLTAVGSATGTNNVALARNAALARARTELSRQLTTNVKGMLSDYQATTTGGGAFGEAAADEQHIEDTARQLTEMTLAGTRQEKTWISQTGTYYVLVSLDVESFESAVDRMDSLSENVRAAVHERAQDAFRRLDAQESR